MEIIKEEEGYLIVEHGGREYPISKTPAIEVKDSDPGEGVQVIISHNVISRNGFESVTDQLVMIRKVLCVIGVVLSLLTFLLYFK